MRTDQRGAWGELRACAELLSRGYYVFRNVGPNCPFDLAVYRDGKFWRVEVKCLHWSKSHDNRPLLTPMFSYPQNAEWDILAVAADDRTFLFDAPVVFPDVNRVIREHYDRPGGVGRPRGVDTTATLG